MIELTQERVELLSKLYNLRGDESVIINTIKEEINNLTTDKENTLLEINEQENIKADLENSLDKFIRETEVFTENFKSFNNDSFVMLKEIGIDIEIGTILDKINLSRPDYETKQRTLIEDTKTVIENKKNIAEDLQNRLNESNDNLKEAEDSQKALNDLLVNIIEQGNADSYNRAFIKSKLEKLNHFSEEEISSLELLILFPEKGLSEFDEKYKNGDMTFEFEEENKKIKLDEKELEELKTRLQEEVAKLDELASTPLFKNTYKVKEKDMEAIRTRLKEEIARLDELAATPVFQNVYNIEEPIFVPFEETPVSKEEVEEQIEPNDTVVEIEPIVVDKVEEPVVPVIELNFNTPKNEKQKTEESYLTKLNLDVDKFNEQTLEIINNASEGIVISNAELLIKELEINSNENVLYKNINNYMYLTDEELKNKVNILRSKGINDKIIKEEIISENFICTKDELSNRLSLLEKNGESVKDNIGLLKNKLELFYANVERLNQAGIPVDDKEKINYRYILSNKEVDEDLEVLKNYLIMLRKTNGKLALNVFNKQSKELTMEIDDLLEADLEELINSNPEILSQNVYSVIKRVKYCSENNIDIKSNSDTYMKYIYDAQVFGELVQNKEVNLEEIKLPSKEEVNSLILEQITNKELVEELNDCYSKEELSSKVLFDNAEIEAKYKNIYNSLTEVLDGLNINRTERVLEIDNVKVSINKFERNLYEIVKLLHEENKDIEENKKEAILVAALYNLSAPKEKVEKIITTCLAEDEEVGGITE